MKYLPLLTIILLLSACNQKQETAQGKWIKGTDQEKVEMIENQFRGFDMAMVETGYRYQELCWTGQDKMKTGNLPITNWSKSKRLLKMD